MKPKAKLKFGIDILMTLMLLFLMGYQFWGDVAHEWAGAGMLALFMIHHLLNVGWHKNVLRGKYNPSRILMLIINILLFADMLGLMISGILLSNHVFAFLGIHGSLSFARLLHMASAYWGFVLMSLHLGLHWGMILGMIRRAGGALPYPWDGDSCLWPDRIYPQGSSQLHAHPHSVRISGF